MLANFVVTSVGDGPVAAADQLPGTLRQAIFDANQLPGADTITFDPTVFAGDTASFVRLTAGELKITDSLTIDASMATDVTLSGDAAGDDVVDALGRTVVADGNRRPNGSPRGLLEDNSRVINFTVDAGDLTIKRTTITGGSNSAQNIPPDWQAGGAGIRFASSGILRVDETTLHGNSTSLGVNGVAISAAGSTVQIVRSTISENVALGSPTRGGGVAVIDGTLEILNSTISGNRAGTGGGVYAEHSDVLIVDGTVAANSAGNGGGVYLRGNGFPVGNEDHSLVILNSLVADNTAAGGKSDVGVMFADIIADYSLIGSPVSTLSFDSFTGSNNLIDVDAQIGPLADNGGPTLTHALMLSSPAIDAGGGSTTAIDQTGQPRPVDQGSLSNGPGDARDIGAFELPAPTSRLVSLPSRIFIPSETPTGIDFGPFTIIDAEQDELTLTLTTGNGTFADPIGGIGVTTALINPQTITLAGRPEALNSYLLDDSKVIYTSESGVTGPNATSINVAIESEPVGSIVLDIAERRFFPVTTAIDVVNKYDEVTSLREAVELANNTPGADTIVFDPTVFTGGTESFIRLTEGELKITDSLTIDASMAVGVTLSGDALGNDVTDVAGLTDLSVTSHSLLNDNSRVLSYSASTGDLTLDSLTLTGGRTTDGWGGSSTTPRSDYAGGAVVFNSLGMLQVINSTFAGNSTAGGRSPGGAIYVGNGDLALKGSRFSGNRVSGAFTGGGAVYVYGGDTSIADTRFEDNRSDDSEMGGGAFFSSGSSAEIVGSQFVGNTSEGEGGGIAVRAGSITISDSLLTENISRLDGGAVRLSEAAAVVISTTAVVANRTTAGDGAGIAAHNGSLEIRDSEVAENQAVAPLVRGGGVYALNVDLGITRSVIRDNTTIGDTGFGTDSLGGGVYSYLGELLVIDSTINGNRALRDRANFIGVGGGIYSYLTHFTLIGSTVSNNLARSGGGLYLERGMLEVSSSTITQNTASSGGGVYIDPDGSQPQLTLFSTVIAGNTASYAAPDFSAGPDLPIVADYNLIGNTSESPVSESTGTGNLLNIDPRLGPLVDNGGPTLTHLPAVDSPLLDAGVSTHATDQRGLPRRFDTQSLPNGLGDGTDIGAVERQDVPPTRLQPSVTAFYESRSHLDLSETLIVDESASSVVVSLSVTSGTWATPADGAGLGEGVSAELTSPQEITLLGSPLDINRYLRTSSNLQYTPPAEVVGPAAATLEVSVDSVPIGSIPIRVVETPGLVVATTADSLDPFDLATSLRESILLANTTPGQQTITFDPAVFTGGEASFIRLVQGELLITDSLAIDASMAEGVTLSGDALGDDITDEHGITDAAASYGDNAGDPDDLLDDNSRVINYDGEEGDLAITRLTVTGGRINHGDVSPFNEAAGAGIRFVSSGGFLLTDSQVLGNSIVADYGVGGGLLLAAGESLIQGSTIAGNRVVSPVSSRGGGGVAVAVGDVTFVSSTISGNHAEYGEASGLLSLDGSVSLLNSTVTRNTAGNSYVTGGVHVRESNVLTVINSIVAGNNTPDWKTGQYTGGVVASHSLLGQPPEYFTGTDAFGPDVLLHVEPVLGPLADNGGPTRTHKPLLSSPALNRGDNLVAPATDQRGLPRNVDGVDIGAVEHQTPDEIPDLIVSTTLDTNDGDLSPGNLSLREAILLANASPGSDTITFDSGVFTGGEESFIRLVSGELEITDSLTIDGSAAIGLIISGDAAANDITDEAGITDALASAPPHPGWPADLLADNTRLLNYTATEGDLALQRVSLTGGRAVGIEYNPHAPFSGGGVRFMSDGTLSIFESTVSGNSVHESRFGSGPAGNGGGVFVATGALLVDRSTISGNTANYNEFSFHGGGNGGGIAAWGPSTTIRNSTISGNVTDADKGAGLHTNSDTIEITHSTITRNSGTGVFIASGSEDQQVSVDGSIIGNNYTIVHSQYRGRSDVLINNAADLSFNRSLISRNFQRFDYVFGTIVEESAGVGNLLNVDPLLGPLADHGGPTKTHAPTLCSPVIDAARSTEATDQRGLARTVDLGGYADSPDSDGTDIGSHEAAVEPTHLIGDYNGDYRVDAADYTVWKDAVGSEVATPMSGADGDGDGRVTVFDLDVWRSRYGVRATPPTVSIESASESPTPRSLPRAERLVQPAADLPIDEAFGQFAQAVDVSSRQAAPFIERGVTTPPRDSTLLLFAADYESDQPEQGSSIPIYEDEADDRDESEAFAVAIGDWGSR